MMPRMSLEKTKFDTIKSEVNNINLAKENKNDFLKEEFMKSSLKIEEHNMFQNNEEILTKSVSNIINDSNIKLVRANNAKLPFNNMMDVIIAKDNSVAFEERQFFGIKKTKELELLTRELLTSKHSLSKKFDEFLK